MKFPRWTGPVLLAALTAAAAAQPAGPGAPKPRQPLLNPGSAPVAKPAAAVFNPELNAKTAIDAAVKRGAAEHRRVLVIWGDNASRWAARVSEQLEIVDTAKMLRNEYVLVLASVADTGAGPLNAALAQAYGAKVETGRVAMPWLTVLETTGEQAGKPVANSDATPWMRPNSSRTSGEFFPIRVQDYLVEHRAPPVKADEVRARALTAAKESGKHVLIYFHDQDEPWCNKFAAWLQQPEIAQTLGKRFIVSTIDLLRMDGAAEQFKLLGGEQSQATPWYLVLDSAGARVAPDPAKGEQDLGFPTGDEIQPFVRMLRRAEPALTDADAAAIEKSLRAAEVPGK